jgi:hypothetical protein
MLVHKALLGFFSQKKQTTLIEHYKRKNIKKTTIVNVGLEAIKKTNREAKQTKENKNLKKMSFQLNELLIRNKY